jgi:hypothetical protein
LIPSVLPKLPHVRRRAVDRMYSIRVQPRAINV